MTRFPILLSILAAIVTLRSPIISVSAETYYIVPDHTSCPTETTLTSSGSFPVTPTDDTPLDEDTTCLTLTQLQYSAQLQSDSEPISPTLLIFAPGNHILSSRLWIVNVKNLILRVAHQNTSVKIICTNSAGFGFVAIPEVSVSGLEFSGCQENSVRWVDQLRMENCRFQNGHGMELRNVKNATFERSFFISLTAFKEVTILWHHTNSGGAIAAFDSNIYMTECLFEKNSAHGGQGGAIATEHTQCHANHIILIRESRFIRNKANNYGAIATSRGSISIYRSYFNGNAAQQHIGAIWSGGNISIHGCVFSSNTAQYTTGAIATPSGTINIHESTFSNNSAVNLAGVLWTDMGIINIYDSNFHSNTAGSGGVIWISQGSINIFNSNFSMNRARSGGVLQSAYQILISIHDSKFTFNTVDTLGGVLYLTLNTSEHNVITNCIFNHNHARSGSAIYVTPDKDSLLAYLKFDGFLQFTNNLASTGVVYASQSTLFFSGNTIFSLNIGSLYVFNSNVTLDGHTNFLNNSGSHDTNVEEGGAITAFQSEILFYGEVNILDSANTDQYGGAILSSGSKFYLYGNTTLAGNTALSGGGICAYQSELNFEGRTILSKNIATMKGGGIYAIGSTVKLAGIGGQIEFIENRAEKGGAICLELNAKLYVIKSKPDNSLQCAQDGSYCIGQNLSSLLLYFTRNSAEYGGALFVSDDTSSGTCTATRDSTTIISDSSSECFFQNLASYSSHPLNIIVKNSYFVDNFANRAGATLFGGLLDRCTINPFAEVFRKYQNLYPFEDTSNLKQDVLSYLTNSTNLQLYDILNQSEVSSKPVHVCFCVNGKPDCDSHQPPTIAVQKGKTFPVSLVAVDQIGNPIPSSVRAVLSSTFGGLAEGQSTQVTMAECTQLNFTITSPRDSEQLILYAEGPCSNLGISQNRVNVTFIPCNCPIGFIQTAQQSNCSCECDSCLSNFITSCSISASSIQRKNNVWISYINETEYDFEDSVECPFLTYPHCPFDYCHPSSSPVWINLNTPNGSDAQCGFNRSGKLCGSCKDGLSLSLGSSRCLSCSNNWLALVIVFAIAGVVLVAFLLVCNLTVAVGTINGVTFYANILTTNRATFFPFQSANFFTIFIAWLNLDFGFVTCFFAEMDGYVREWLQLVFPVYIIFMVTMVIIGCEYSTRIASLFTGTNPVATLATLILLSYAKSLRVIIAVLSSATLEYPDGSQKRVWLVDADVLYFQGKHIPLFLVALLILLVGIVYTFLLFFYQWLLYCSNRKALQWIKNARFYPFMDAYLAPYNIKHRYWTGLLLLVRAFLYVVAALNVSGDPGNNLLSIICTIACLLLLKLLLHGKIYKSWPLDTLETSFLFNLLVFSAGSLYIRAAGNGNQEALAYTSTGIAFVTFLAIVTYHIYTFVLPKKAKNKLEINCLRMRPFAKKEKNLNHEIILTLKNAVTYSVVDGIPSQHKLDDGTVTAKLDSAAATKTKPSNSPLDIRLEPGQDNQTESKSRSISANLSVLDSYNHHGDCDKLGKERETEINDFLRVTQ